MPEYARKAQFEHCAEEVLEIANDVLPRSTISGARSWRLVTSFFQRQRTHG
jgi:hypothetical protein